MIQLSHPESELATLGLILEDPRGLSSVRQYLDTKDFCCGPNAAIYQALLNLMDDGADITLVALMNKMEEAGHFKELDDKSNNEQYNWILRLPACAPTNGNIHYYARIVQVMSIRRKLIAFSNDLISESNNLDVAISDTLAIFSDRLAGITDESRAYDNLAVGKA